MTAKILQKQGKIQQALDIALAIALQKPTECIMHYIG